MTLSRIRKTQLLVASLLALLLPAILPSQETAQEQKFFEVEIKADEIYSYKQLKFTGDYTSFESPAGYLALGRTEKGVTILIVLGGGTVTITSPDEMQENFAKVFPAHPFKTAFQTLYMRLHPQDFENAFAEFPLTKAPNEEALAKAKLLFEERFRTSYHAGHRAMFPPVKTRVMDFQTAAMGLITTEEGYWLTLRRLSPWASAYPKGFVNPKQR